MGTKRSGGGSGGGTGGRGPRPGSNDGGSAQSSLERDNEADVNEVEEACEEQAEETKVPEREGKTVAERRDRLREVLEERFDITDEHIIGSLTRGTLVGPLSPDSDTDVMFVLDEDEHGDWVSDENGARNCLRQIKRAIQNDPRYQNTDVRIDRNVVAVEFSDFTVEIAPGFKRGDDYVIPDTYQGGRSWVRTNPRRYKQIFEATNEASGGNLQKLARLAKKYNEGTGKNVSSYHMELMAYDYMRNRPADDRSFDEHVGAFFEQLPERVSSGTYNPSTQQRIDRGMSHDKRREAISDAKAAREKVQRANRLKQSGNEEKAKELYEEVLNGELSD
jgi:hypothetical protein